VQHANLPAHAEGRKATWFELFFDLVFVVAVAQLAGSFSHHYDWAGAGIFVFGLLVIWWCWLGHTFFATRLDEDSPGQRGLGLVQILAVAWMAYGATDLSGARAWVFASGVAAFKLLLACAYGMGWRWRGARGLIRTYAAIYVVQAALWAGSLALPATMAITNAETEGTERQLERLEEALAGGLRLVQVRDKGWPAAQRLWFAETVVRLAHDRGALVVINDDAEIARRTGADGLHLSSASLAACAARPDFAWVGASCHTAEEIAHAGQLGLDYALLGPVLPTPTHPENPGLGWEGFVRLTAGNTLPVFALGGMRPDLLPAAQEKGAHGIALMRGW